MPPYACHWVLFHRFLNTFVEKCALAYQNLFGEEKQMEIIFHANFVSSLFLSASRVVDPLLSAKSHFSLLF